MKDFIHNDWWSRLENEFMKPYYKELQLRIAKDYGFYRNKQGGIGYISGNVFPEPQNIFNAFKLTPFSKTKVVILGQDPYPQPNTAMGLSFSVMPGHKLPGSLINIYKELHSDVKFKMVNNGCLVPWAKQGILMLNSILTVKNGRPMSYKNAGWEQLTDTAIKELSQKSQPVIFILWGNKAQNKDKLINNKENIILESSHPSPLSANKGFFGSRPFSKTNLALKTLNEKEINWQLPAKYTIDDMKKDLR